MKKIKLGTQLNISFALVLFVPMIIAAVFSIVYYGQKIEEEAIHTIESDLKIAQLIYTHAVDGMAEMANAYAQKKTLTVLLGLHLGEKLGEDLARSTMLDDLDMVTVVDTDYRVIVRAHAPRRIDDLIEHRPFIDAALAGNSLSGTEVLNRQLLWEEGIIIDERLFGKEEKVLAITGAAPIYDRQREKIMAAIVIRRFLDDESRIVKEICRNLDVSATLFQGIRPVAACTPASGRSYVPPVEDLLKSVLAANSSMAKAEISRGGGISNHLPVRDFNGVPVGILSVQRGVETYLHTRNTATIALVAILLTGLILALIVKTIIVRRILHPVQRLKHGTERIGQGEYDHLLDVTSEDEIGELTLAFNTMALDLQTYDRQIKEHNLMLEERVRERTSELEAANDKLVRSNAILEETLEILNPGVSRLIGSNRQQLGLVYATELVADVCTYTKLNMILGETMMGEFMKRFFRESHKLLAEYRGMFDKTVGDQIVAIFGTPKDDSPESPIHPFDAVECALRMMAAAQGINRIMQEAIQDNYSAIAARHQSLSEEDRKDIRIEDLKFQCRVGINTSNPSSDREIDRMRMVMMGAETCVDYTAQGGAVIYAFRLESNGIPGKIQIGENTKRLVEHIYTLEEVPPINLKGLGVQAGYRVTGKRSLFENLYPKTLFYGRFLNRIPETLTHLLNSVKVGRIQIREVRRINEYIDVDIPYVEHYAGYYNLCAGRALFAAAVAEILEMEKERIDAILFASLWYNAIHLKENSMPALVLAEPQDQLPESIDSREVLKILEDLNHPNPEMLSANIIRMCNRFDDRVFDRTYLRNKSQEIVAAKEMISLMKIEGGLEPRLIQALEEMMIVPSESGDAGVHEEDLLFTLSGDPESITETLLKRLNPEQRKALVDRLLSAPEIESSPESESNPN